MKKLFMINRNFDIAIMGTSNSAVGNFAPAEGQTEIVLLCWANDTEDLLKQIESMAMNAIKDIAFGNSDNIGPVQ